MKKEALTTMGLRRRNRNKVMSILIKRVTATKNELQKETQFSYSTIGNILNDLLIGGYISKTKKAPSTGGRKPKIISLNYNKFLFLSIDLSIHNFHWAIHDLRGTIIFNHFYSYDYESGFKNNIMELIKEIMVLCRKNKIDTGKICSLGIATPGYYREKNGHIFRSSYDELESINIKEAFSKKLDMPILIVNDANVAAYNEIYSFNYLDSLCMIYLLITKEGVGSAITIRGEIFTGARGYAGETHIIPIEYKGKITMLGDLLLPETDMKYLSSRLGMEIDDKTFFKLFEEKNPYAMEIYEKTVHALSSGLFQILNLLNPSDIIISGFYNPYGDRMAADILKRIKAKVNPYQIEGLKISLSHFSEETILMGLGKKLINQWCGRI